MPKRQPFKSFLFALALPEDLSQLYRYTQSPQDFLVALRDHICWTTDGTTM
ncbi:MAG: hypothetical protein ACTHMC_24370 [Pseudobacter sp.]|uniref:hypothetical protein n=1 Tax=Pseudobacter sp. TaxID=2045420 RepID=UPI003F80DFF0